MSDNPKINHVLELVTAMNRAQETGRTDFDPDSRLKRMLNLATTLDEFLAESVLERGLSISDIVEVLITIAVNGLAESIQDEDRMTQVSILGIWNTKFLEITGMALLNNLKRKKS